MVAVMAAQWDIEKALLLVVKWDRSKVRKTAAEWDSILVGEWAEYLARLMADKSVVMMDEPLVVTWA
jgi:hypothetical protein